MSKGARKPAGAVRIVGGRWRNTRLPVADLPGLRPTPDRVRETLFNWLQPVLPGARVLDLFAGSGALGLESLSRGAREAWLVERDPRQASALDAAVDRLGASATARVVRADALEFLQLPLHGRFDVVFLDPPYGAGAWAPALARLPAWLEPGAWMYLESPAAAPVRPGEGWLEHRRGATRDADFALYRRGPAAAGTLAADSRTDGATDH